MTITEAPAGVTDVRDTSLPHASCLFRVLNDQIRDIERFQEGEHDFVCECSDEACTRVLRMDFGEYIALRSDIQTFAVVPGHDEGLDVLIRSAQYVVIRNGAARSPLLPSATPKGIEGTMPAERKMRRRPAARWLAVHLVQAREFGGRVGRRRLLGRHRR